MRYVVFYLLLFLSFSCKAQNIVPLFDGPLGFSANDYFKDLDNDLNTFEGSWKWEEGDSSWTIQFKKIEMEEVGRTYSDILIGEY